VEGQIAGELSNDQDAQHSPSPRIALAADLQSEASNVPPEGTSHSSSLVDHITQTSIAYDVQDGVIRLLPVSLDQWNDFPSLLSYARWLGAEDAGVFMVLLPQTERAMCKPPKVMNHRASLFHARREGHGGYHRS
jgi:hypothetical protein